MCKSNNSISFYNENADDFVAGTLNVDMGELYSRFLTKIPKGGLILDAGCGSGRDSLYFLKHGYEVTAFDGSCEMAKRSSALTGLEVLHLTFDELEFTETFDGVWACASVLHVPKNLQAAAIKKLSQATKVNGILYLSYKYGHGEESRKGRHFTNFTKESFGELIGYCPSLRIVEMWKTGDVRPGREDEMWLNIVLKKVSVS